MGIPGRGDLACVLHGLLAILQEINTHFTSILTHRQESLHIFESWNKTPMSWKHLGFF
jgi:hypothetical protein